jgi:hypothetical protein
MSTPTLDLRDVLRDQASGVMSGASAADEISRRMKTLMRDTPDLANSPTMKSFVLWIDLIASEVISDPASIRAKTRDSELIFLCSELEKWGRLPPPGTVSEPRCIVLTQF